MMRLYLYKKKKMRLIASSLFYKYFDFYIKASSLLTNCALGTAPTDLSAT